MYFWFFDDEKSEHNRTGVMPGNVVKNEFDDIVQHLEIIKMPEHIESFNKNDWLAFIATRSFVQVYILSKNDNHYDLIKTGLQVPVCADQIIVFKNRVFVHNVQNKRLEELVMSYINKSWLVKLMSVNKNLFENNYQIKRIRSNKEQINFKGIRKFFSRLCDNRNYVSYENIFSYDTRRNIIYQLTNYKIKKVRRVPVQVDTNVNDNNDDDRMVNEADD